MNESTGMQPLAYWEFEDCFTFAEAKGCGLHPLHEQGYPSLGDVHSTLPVPRESWFEYGAERSGRFQGLTNADGSTKTECGAPPSPLALPCCAVHRPKPLATPTALLWLHHEARVRGRMAV